MKFQVLLLSLFIAILFGCSDNAMQNKLAEPSEKNVTQNMIQAVFSDYNGKTESITLQPDHSGKAVEKKLKINAAGTMIVVPNEGCPGNFQTLIEGEGNASHLGLFTIELDYCTDGQMPTGPISGVQTAANGDQLFTTVVGANPMVGSLDFAYTGGTGRFEGATGFVTLYFTFDYMNGTWSNYGNGWIMY